MKIKNLSFCLSVSALVASMTTLSAQAGSIDAGLTVGTLGFGPQVGWVISPDQFALRASLGLLNYSNNTNSSGVNYSGQLKLENLSVMGDWHPFAGSFRTTGGVFYNKNKLNLNGGLTPGQNYSANGVNYTAQAGDAANAQMNFKTFVPYLGIGWGDASFEPGLHFTSDFGVMFQGSPSGSVSINNPNAAQYSAAAQSKLQNDLNNFRIYPVAQIGAVYRF